MIYRLPGWVWGGAALLALIAGMINVVGLLGVHHHGLTHVTGSASAMGLELAQGSLPTACRFGLLILAFVAGAVLSAVVVRNANLRLGRRYGVALMIESALLIAAALLLTRGRSGGEYLLSAAAGLQNAMASTYSGAIVRTTHVTGIFTDIGILIGHALRGEPFEARKLSLLITIAVGFIGGSAVGGVVFQTMGFSTLWVLAAVTGIGGAVYFVVYHWYRSRSAMSPAR